MARAPRGIKNFDGGAGWLAAGAQFEESADGKVCRTIVQPGEIMCGLVDKRHESGSAEGNRWRHCRVWRRIRVRDLHRLLLEEHRASGRIDARECVKFRAQPRSTEEFHIQPIARLESGGMGGIQCGSGLESIALARIVAGIANRGARTGTFCGQPQRDRARRTANLRRARSRGVPHRAQLGISPTSESTTNA